MASTVATTDTLETLRTQFNTLVAEVGSGLTIVDDSSNTSTLTIGTDSLKISGGTGLESAVSGDVITINDSNTGVSAASYGSSTAIPVVTINAQGRITNASTASISTDLTVIDDASTSATISLASDSFKISGGTGTTSAISGDTLTINLDNTAVSAASYGSSTAIPVITVDAQGRITAASTASISTDLTVIDDASSSATISLANDSFKIAGGTGLATSISGDVLTINDSNTGVSAASYGSSSAIPVITVNAQGRITSVSTASVSGDLTIVDDSSTSEVITLGSETLKFAGGTGLTSTITSGTVTYAFDGTTFTDFEYTATGGQTTFTGSDDNGATLAYTAGKADVFVNGVKLDGSDFTATNGTSVVLASAAAVNDIVCVKAYSTINVSSLNADNISSGTLNSARLPTVPTTKGGTGLTSIGSAGQALIVNSGADGLEFGSAGVSQGKALAFSIILG